MSEQNSSQLELFSRSAEHSERRPGRGNYFLRRIWVYERTILLAMGFIITAIVAFSLGVEKGKSLAGLKSEGRFDTAGKRQPAMQASRTKFIPNQQQPLAEKKPAAVMLRQNAVMPQKPGENTQNYTIQLASYKSKTSAQKEADILKKKGLSPLIVSKGKYAVLCVGAFSDKENAKSLLSELGKQYHGCFIRRI